MLFLRKNTWTHRFQVISIRQEYRSDQLELENAEVLDIEWHSWDSSHFLMSMAILWKWL